MKHTYKIVYRKPGQSQVKEATHVKPFTDQAKAEIELEKVSAKHPQWDFWIQVEDR